MKMYITDLQITQIGRPICFWFANRTSDLQIRRQICVICKSDEFANRLQHIFRAMMQPVLLPRSLAVAVAEKTITKMNPCFQSRKRLFACSPLTCLFANSNKLPLLKKGANMGNDGNLLFRMISNDLKKSCLIYPWKCTTSH